MKSNAVLKLEGPYGTAKRNRKGIVIEEKEGPNPDIKIEISIPCEYRLNPKWTDEDDLKLRPV